MGHIQTRHADTAQAGQHRATLRVEIERRDTLVASLATMKAAKWDTDQSVHAARRAQEQAAENIATAKDRASDYRVNVSVGISAEAPETIQVARRKLVEAEDELEIARKTRTALEQRMALVADELAKAERFVDAAALRVIGTSPRVAELVAEVEQLQREMIDKAAAVEWLVGRNLISEEPIVTGKFTSEAAPVVMVMNRYSSPPRTWRGLIESCAGAKPWTDALAALKKDADAALPI